MRKVPFLLEPTFFIHQDLRIKVTLSVIKSPQMCFNIRRGIYLSSCENLSPTCSAALTSPSSPPRPSLLLLLHLVLAQCSSRHQTGAPPSPLTRSIRHTGHDGVCPLTLFGDKSTTLALLKTWRHNWSDVSKKNKQTKSQEIRDFKALSSCLLTLIMFRE